MNYHNITHDDMNNGDGIRVVLWVSGCNHHCLGCQNPQTWNINSGILFDEPAFLEVMEDLRKDYISGITFSGGDPLHPENRAEVLKIAKEAKRLGKTVWIYTGYTFEELLRCQVLPKDCDILNYCDVLVDGRYMENLRNINLKWRGSLNQKVVNVPESLKLGYVVLHCE